MPGSWPGARSLGGQNLCPHHGLSWNPHYLGQEGQEWPGKLRMNNKALFILLLLTTCMLPNYFNIGVFKIFEISISWEQYLLYKGYLGLDHKINSGAFVCQTHLLKLFYSVTTLSSRYSHWHPTSISSAVSGPHPHPQQFAVTWNYQETDGWLGSCLTCSRKDFCFVILPL